MEALLALDRRVFFFINHLPHSFVFDQLALLFSGVGTWGAVWVVIALFIFFREEKRDPWFFLPSALVLVGATICEYMIKAFIARPRPTDLIAGFSFPSTHATLAFAFAYILSREEPKLKYWFYMLAVLISLSRVYLGVHYPLDVIGGALLGWGVGRVALLGKKNTPGGFTKNL